WRRWGFEAGRSGGVVKAGGKAEQLARVDFTRPQMKDGHAPHLLDRARQPLHHMITRPWRVVVEQKGERSPGERGADEKAGDPEAPVDQHGVWLHEEVL